MVKCLSCGGIYAPTQADGAEYYHVCPPLSVPELKAALKAGSLVVTPAFQATIDAAAAVDAKRALTDTTPLAVDTVLASIAVARHLERNENPAGPAPTPLAPTPIIAEGKGILKLLGSDGPPIVATVAPAPPIARTP